MKILHTSDLHLGKKLSEESFHEDQKHILKEITKIIKERKIKVVMIPGDIYDKSNPPVEAVQLFDDFITNLTKMNVEVMFTSGNHDSNERLGFGSKIFESFNIHIATSYDGQIKKIEIDDVNFYLLPFLKPFHLKKLMDEEEYGHIKNTNDMMKWILSQETMDKNKKNILLAHQFVMSGDKLPKQCDSESISLNSVGTLDAIDVDLLDEFDYVALGHLHRPQDVKRNTVRYSGTPLKYSFSEVKDDKSVVIIDTDNIEDFELVELKPLRNMQVIRGKFEDIMKMEPCDDIIKIELTDENTIISPMDSIRQRFNNAIALVFTNIFINTHKNNDVEIKEDASPYELFKLFFEEQNDREMKIEEEKLIESIFKDLEGNE